MPRFRPGDNVLLQFRRPDLIRLQFRDGSGLPPTFQVLRVLPPGDDGEPGYHIRCASEPYARVAKEHELAPAR
jgi:hypothetical protein